MKKLLACRFKCSVQGSEELQGTVGEDLGDGLALVLGKNLNAGDHFCK